MVAGWFTGKVAGFELNLSCPHAEGYGAAIGTDPALVEACTRAVSKSGVPTWVKITPNVTDITTIGKAAERGGASAIVAINTVKAMRISTAMRRPVLGNRFGGMSGSAVFPVAVRCVYELYDAVKIPLIGCGGIASADNVVEMMMAGARAVEIGSAVQADATVFEKICAGLYTKDGLNPDGTGHHRPAEAGDPFCTDVLFRYVFSFLPRPVRDGLGARHGRDPHGALI
jgi:dihydroorotate dehydrogenase (NAD+) catalytic subunit